MLDAEQAVDGLFNYWKQKDDDEMNTEYLILVEPLKNDWYIN